MAPSTKKWIIILSTTKNENMPSLMRWYLLLDVLQFKGGEKGVGGVGIRIDEI